VWLLGPDRIRTEKPLGAGLGLSESLRFDVPDHLADTVFPLAIAEAFPGGERLQMHAVLLSEVSLAQLEPTSLG